MFERKEPFKRAIHAIIIMYGVVLLGILFLFIRLGPDNSFNQVFWVILVFISLFLMGLCFYYAYKLDIKNRDKEKIQKYELVVRLAGATFAIPFVFAFIFTIATIENERLLYALVTIIVAIQVLNLVLFILDLVKTDDHDCIEIG